MPTYGQQIKWRNRDGSVQAVEIHDRNSADEALSDALAIAKEMGWTRPRWWQWWRWGDLNYEPPNASPPV